MRPVLALVLAACGGATSGGERDTAAAAAPSWQQPRVDRESRVFTVDACDHDGNPRQVGPGPDDDRVRIMWTCAGELVCDPGPRARLRDKLACKVDFAVRPGTRGRYRRWPPPIRRAPRLPPPRPEVEPPTTR